MRGNGQVTLDLDHSSDDDNTTELHLKKEMQFCSSCAELARESSMKELGTESVITKIERR